MTSKVKLTRPWTIIEHQESFEIQSSSGISVAYVYFDEGDPIRQAVRKRMDRASALAVAKAIAKIGA